MSTLSYKEYVGVTHDWPGRVCFVVSSSGLGGTETLAIRQSRWMRRNNIRTAIITRAGVMDAEYRAAFDQVYLLDNHEVDSGSLLMDEWYRLLDRIADGLRLSGSWHFLAFAQEGTFISCELSSRITGSTASIYLVDDIRYGPARLDYVESMSRHGLFISMNEACLEAHRRNYGYVLDNAVVIPLPMSTVREERPVRNSGRVRVVTVARLVPMKGYVEGLIAAIAKVVRDGQLDMELQVIGDGPLMPRLKLSALKAGICGRVSFVGSVPYADLPAYYRGADVFVGMGTTALEAASYRLPVIIAEAYTYKFLTPGLFSTQQGFGLGEPSKASSSNCGEQLLASLVKDGSLRHAEGEAGWLRLQEEFSEDVVMGRFLAHLRANSRQIINIPSPGTDRICGETKRYIKRLLSGSSEVAAFRRHLRAGWEVLRALIS